MLRKVLIAGVLGGFALMLWTFATNVFFEFNRKIDMKRIPNESSVHQVLRENLVEPGGYVCNPPLTPVGVFPGNEPVFSIRYSGMGHEAAAVEFVVQTAMAILSAIIAAWLLSVASNRILSAYSRRVLFISALGLLFALFSDLAKFGIGGYPLRSVLLLAANSFVSWILAGLVMARWMKPNL